MTISIVGKQIDRVVIVDDDAASRSAVARTVTDAGVDVLPLDGPFPTLTGALQEFTRVGQALVSDHHMLSPYAGFRGASAVAEAYKSSFPGILCTAWEKANIEEIRLYRRWLPSVVDSGSTDPEIFVQGFEKCLREFRGEFAPSRKPHPVQVRIEEACLEPPNPYVFVVLPGWSTEVIKLLAMRIPDEIIKKIKYGFDIFHAIANKGSDDSSEIYVEEWTE